MFIIAVIAISCASSFAKIIQLGDKEKQDLINSHNQWRINSNATAMLKMVILFFQSKVGLYNF
jgi:hypothetical protein